MSFKALNEKYGVQDISAIVPNLEEGKRAFGNFLNKETALKYIFEAIDTGCRFPSRKEAIWEHPQVRNKFYVTLIVVEPVFAHAGGDNGEDVHIGGHGGTDIP